MPLPSRISLDALAGIGAEAIVTPPPLAIARLPNILPDPPVPYYSQIPLSDDQAFNPAFELLPSEVKLGWNVLTEVDLVKPFIHNGLNSGPAGDIAFISTLPEAVSVPTAQPSWTAMPRLDVFYRFDRGLGELHATFRTLGDQGTQTLANFDTAGAGVVTSHLSLNTFDLDYAYTEFNPGRVPRILPLFMLPGHLGLDLRPEDDPYPTFRLRWAFGTRMANVFFDSQGAGHQILQERVMNNFVGGGLHTWVDFSKPLPWRPSVSFYCRGEASGLFGDATQSFSRSEVLPNSSIATGVSRVRDISLGVPVVAASIGLSYVPQWRNSALRLSTGYQYEQWWYLGDTVGYGGSSTVALTLQGMFFRCEFGK
jgi:hypothetical protein